MSAETVSTRAAAPAALVAFLRGVERRGAVLAELQAGDADAGDAAVAEAMRQFCQGAADLPISDWPGRYWSLLLAQPRLRYRTPTALHLDATDGLAELGCGPRAALLLRLAAGLSEADAAAALGVAEPTFRLALQRGLPHYPDDRADPPAWQRLRDEVHRRIKTLPADRLLRLGLAREAALAGRAAPVAAMPVLPPVPRRRPRWLLASLWMLLVLCAAAFVASFWWSPPTWLPGDADGRVRVEPLPAAAAPASRYGADAAAVADRDFALLADPEGQAAAADLGFHSWLAAQDDLTAVPAPGTAVSGGAEATVPTLPVRVDGEAAVLESHRETGDAPR